MRAHIATAINNKTTTKCATKTGKQQTGSYLIHSSKYLATLSAGILAAIFSIDAIDSFAQRELTTSAQNQGSNATSATTASLGEPLFVEQGRIQDKEYLLLYPNLS